MNRVSQLDSLRGLATLGLLLLNVYYLALFESGYIPSVNPPFSDMIIQYANILLLDSRFRSIFCMLFGAALALQYSKCLNEGALKPRLIALTIFGALHGILIWPGDIILSYGIAGFLALTYLQQSDQRVLYHGSAIFVASCILLLILSLVDSSDVYYRNSAKFEEMLTHAPVDLFSLLIHNITMFVVMLLMLPILTLWNALGIMLIGIYCYRNDTFINGLSKRAFSLILSFIVLLSTVSSTLEYIDSNKFAAINESITWLNALFGALLIAHINAKVSATNKLVKALQAVGKLALTCYLLQSIVMITFFVWFAPEARLTFNRIDYVLLALFGIGVQLVIAPLYLKYFTQGPFERLLKLLTLQLAKNNSI
ncbi:hypothetical protein PSECIP111951_03682 [Pseudoalteromonas holothuriae]|uniref:DUF418 domain-containing protein n=1 Tax=Pseudoalteromonas holothuriae TaxID=2963714 RepID=A0A9W4R0C4_9GAMM|nr:MULTISPECIES: DUF418 domain-containing protein [unclassified Pseudoalteromonas]CAH9062326.1 hypothetical protein PSECIP111854_02989 [Pseudoalteromonas sp. CIP111854]CAH9066974.1 hypothetical protein PSECIP111951_03682 [Pseudoalteromonas sp. CIP111951]